MIESLDKDNVFIDNLPKDEPGIKGMLRQINWHIRTLEQ